jgi:hypothetical protein
MIGRAWNVFAYGWFFVFVLNGMTKVGGIGMGDLWLASAPWWIGKIAALLLRYVLTGSIASPSIDLPRPRALPKPLGVK